MTQELAAFISAVLCLLLGILVVVYRHRNPVNIFFFIINALVFFWISGDFVIPTVNQLSFGLIYDRVAQVGGILLAPVYAVFSLLLVGKSLGESIKNPVVITFLVYTIVFFALIPTNLLIESVEIGPFREKAGALLAVEVGFLFLSILFNFYQIVRAMKGSSRPVRMKLLFFNAAIIVALAAPLVWLTIITRLHPSGNYPVYLFVVLYALMTAYAILRYQFMDIHVMIKRSTLLIVVIAILSAGYYLISMLFEMLMAYYRLTVRYLPGLLSVITLALAYIPFRGRYERIINQLIFRRNFLYSEALQRFTDDIALLLDISELSDRIVGSIREVFDVKAVSLLLDDGISLTDRRDGTVNNDGRPSAGVIPDEVRKRLMHGDHTISDYFYQDENLFLPLVFNYRLIGVLIVGVRENGQLYTSEEISLLKTFAKQSAIALSNSLTYQKSIDKEKTDRDLEIAAQIQKLFLPSVLDQVPGLEIVVHYSPAMVIGGDYYDVIRLDENKAVIILMDISGHGSSAAIVLSMISSYFHSNVLRFTHPGELVADMNREMMTRLKSQKYATGIILYWDIKSRSITWTNAGHPEFIHISKSGTLLPIERGIDPPVGIIENQTYSTHHKTLHEGEKIVLFTDGVYETMNSREIMIGMDKVLEHVEELGTGNPNDIIRGLIKILDEFRENTGQSDDIAIMIIKSQ